MQISHLNNMEFLALNDQFFIPAKLIVQKIWISVDIIFIIVVTIFQNFYRFLAILILEFQLDKILLLILIYFLNFV